MPPALGPGGAWQGLRLAEVGDVRRDEGRAPHGLKWEMGIRPGVTPLLSYRSGDPARVPQSSRPFNPLVGGQP